ncbi:hypothetical protein K4A07_18895, partial [Lactiplantibacillus plantarum]|nr:hypothetical protein [Lactiplantibacillus plantarum]
ILHWVFQHFVLLKAVKGRRVEIFDPSRGDRKVELMEVSEYFTGVAMELTPTPSFKRKRERAPLKLSSLLAFTPDIRGGLVQALLLSLLIQLYVIVSPFYMQSAIDGGAM